MQFLLLAYDGQDKDAKARRSAVRPALWPTARSTRSTQ